MARFQKKSELVEAVVFGSTQDIPDGMKPWKQNQPHPIDGSWGYIDTAKGRESVWIGDWIITDASSKRSICKPDVFETAYEPVEVI
jgi:hypothetical protein